VDEVTIDAVLAELREHRLLDDSAFAQYWVDQRQTFRPRGGRLLRAELARLGVAAPLAGVAAAAAAPTADEDAYRVAARHAPRLRQLDRRTFEGRLSGFLARRGFEWDTIGPVVARVWSELSTSSGSGPAPRA
jgi:regulatory protein